MNVLSSCMFISLLHVSTSLIRNEDEECEVARILSVADARNPGLGITGALILARGHFAQLLEGPSEGIDEMMSSLRRDPRHTDINVLVREPVAERRFPEWAMAYAGPSTYVERAIRPLMPRLQEAQTRAASVQRIIELMERFRKTQ